MSGTDQSFSRCRHVARPKDTRKVLHTTTLASSLKQGLCRAQRIGHPDHPNRAARRLRRGVEGVWRGISERLSSDGRGPGQCQVRKLQYLFSLLSFKFNDAGGRACLTITALHYHDVPQASPAELHGALERTREAYVYFRSIPAPKRGEIIRQIREALAAKVRRVTS